MSAGSLREFADRVRTRADTTLALIPDSEFEQGLFELDRDANAETTPSPVLSELYLLALR